MVGVLRAGFPLHVCCYKDVLFTDIPPDTCGVTSYRSKWTLNMWTRFLEETSEARRADKKLRICSGILYEKTFN